MTDPVPAPAPGEPAPTAPAPSDADKLLASFKEAGLANPAGALDLIKELRQYEKGDKLPDAVAKRLADLEAAAKTAEDAKLTSEQRLQKRIDDLEAKDKVAEERTAKAKVDAAIVSAAKAAGAIDADAMPALIDSKKLTIDKDSGEPTNLADVIKTLKKDKPQWFGQGGGGSFDGGARGTESSEVTKDDLLKSMPRL